MHDVLIITGHQTYSPGAANMNGPGQEDDIYEYYFNDPLCAAATEKLKARGIEAVHNRYHDVRHYSHWSGKSRLLVEVHCNAFNTKATGTETLFFKGSTRGRKAARAVQDVMVDRLKLPNRGIKPRTRRNRGGYILAGVSQVALITEAGFIDNNKDLRRMQKVDMATMYADAIEAALKVI